MDDTLTELVLHILLQKFNLLLITRLKTREINILMNHFIELCYWSRNVMWGDSSGTSRLCDTTPSAVAQDGDRSSILTTCNTQTARQIHRSQSQCETKKEMAFCTTNVCLPAQSDIHRAEGILSQVTERVCTSELEIHPGSSLADSRATHAKHILSEMPER